jgi:hypothetical protein
MDPQPIRVDARDILSFASNCDHRHARIRRGHLTIRAALAAFALIGAYADVGSIRFNVVKAGFVISGSPAAAP